MRRLEPKETPLEYVIIGVLASLVMQGLLVRVIGAPHNPPVAVMALVCGLSIATIIRLLFSGAV